MAPPEVDPDMCNQWIRRWSARSVRSGSISSHESALDPKEAAPCTIITNIPTCLKLKNAKPPRAEERRGAGRFALPLGLGIKLLAVAVLLAAGAAFSAGCLARAVLLAKIDAAPSSGGAAEAFAVPGPQQLPAPAILPGKDVPLTTYTSKTFPVEGSAASHTLHIDRRGADNVEPTVRSADEGAAQTDSAFAVEHAFSEDEDDGDPAAEELHLPAGQHLLVDIKDVDSEFLNSETRLANAMVELINESKLTLLSYHCHNLVPMGVSCVGVLLESHVAFHTWPEEGVITMDLFTCGASPLIPVLPSIERLFAVPRAPADGAAAEDAPAPTTTWSHKLRGFREGFAPEYDHERNPLEQDLGQFVLGTLGLDVKDEVVSEGTDFQTVDVYDVMFPKTRSFASYQKSLSGDGSYEASHPEQFGPDRVLFLDGVIQSTLYGDAPYHESIVHPAMVTHPNPRRVAIIGGGEGATLREVLKHNTVEEAVMIEIDEGVVRLSRDHLPAVAKLQAHFSSREGGRGAFDDDRTNARFEDAMAYFIDHFHSEETDEEAYEVIVMDALDPNDNIEFAVELYTSDTYIQSLYNALTEDGILVVQVGEVPDLSSPADETGRFANRAVMKEKLDAVGFKSIHVYEEAHSGFLSPWTTLVAFKDIKTRANWYRSPAEIELQLQKRILPSKTGASSLRYFDGATMHSYQMPSNAFRDRALPSGERARRLRQNDVDRQGFFKRNNQQDGSV
ncbi:hypothetical protein ACHAXT_004342 [Thalassiosira profunda]